MHEVEIRMQFKDNTKSLNGDLIDKERRPTKIEKDKIRNTEWSRLEKDRTV